MDLQHFEQRILQLAFETESRITTASVAYYLGIPSREANQFLNSLLEEGTLELDSDSDGNLFYTVPNHAEEVRAISELKKSEATENARRVTNAVFRAVELPQAQESAAVSPIQGYATLDADVDSTANAMVPSKKPFAYQQAPRKPKPPAAPVRDIPKPRTGLDGSSGEHAPEKRRSVVARKSEGGPVWGSVASRAASTDGTIGAAAPGSSFLVSTTARCEPRPLPKERPIIAACDEIPASRSMAYHEPEEEAWFGPIHADNSLVPAGAGETAIDYYIEQPEHQPGMALLLSLILCGTGQIYNGELTKGVMMMVLCFLLWLVLLGWVVHIWSIVDAVVVAERMNRSSEVPG